MADKFSPEELEQLPHSEHHAGFSGNYEFDITFEVLGKRVSRRIRAEYTFTPEWEYYDLQKRGLYVGWPGSGVGFSIFTVPADDIFDDKDDEEGEWLQCEGFAGPGVLPREVWDRIDEIIEERAKKTDAERRSAAGL